MGKIGIILIMVLLQGCSVASVLFQRFAEDTLIGYMCSNPRFVENNQNVQIAIEFLVSLIGESCGESSVEVRMALDSKKLVRKALRLRIGQEVKLHGEMVSSGGEGVFAIQDIGSRRFVVRSIK